VAALYREWLSDCEPRDSSELTEWWLAPSGATLVELQ
jgi:hypothetical protein